MKYSSIFLLLGLSLMLPASAVIVAGASGGGNTSNNTTQAQFESESGIPFPIYDNIIRYSDASGVYLGYNANTHDVWVLTARHIIASTADISIAGLGYSFQQEILVGGDLRLVRYNRADMAVPNLPSINLASSMPLGNDDQMMVGYGQNRAESGSLSSTQSDAVDISPSPATGYHWAGPSIKRWGTNNIESEFLDELEEGTAVTGALGTFSMGGYTTVGFMTDFDKPGFNRWQSSNEGQGSLGDSGGGAFTYANNQWYLTGIMGAIATFDNQEGSTAAFGNVTLLTDVSTYNSAINSAIGVGLIPEPSVSILVFASGLALTWLGRKRR